MSWSIRAVGKAKNVVAHVQNDPEVPQEIKDLLAKLATRPSNEYLDTLHVVGFGHGGSCKIEVSQLQSAPQPLDSRGYVS